MIKIKTPKFIDQKNKDIAIQLIGVSKKYVIHHEKPTLVENILKKGRYEEFWALKDINLKIMKGETVGIVGHNGSGKTTLLEILAGITTPTTGNLHVSGKTVSLIELGAGFQQDLTGEENIYLNGMILGMTKEEIKNRFSEIVMFADLKQFIDAPLFTYSSGMALRLGFSIAVHSDPDILLLDENMSVGDYIFHKKSFNRIREFIRKGKTVVTVTHNLRFISRICRRILFLEKGVLVMDGGHDVLWEYEPKWKSEYFINRRNSPKVSR